MRLQSFLVLWGGNQAVSVSLWYIITYVRQYIFISDMLIKHLALDL